MGGQKAVEVLRPYVPYGVRVGFRYVETARLTSHYSVYARLKPGVTLKQAQAEIHLLQEQLKREHPRSVQGVVGGVMSLHEATFGRTRPIVLMLSAAVALVLFLGCTNVAGLLLARGVARAQEMSIRAAMGSGHLRRLLIPAQVAVVIVLLAAAAPRPISPAAQCTS